MVKGIIFLSLFFSTTLLSGEHHSPRKSSSPHHVSADEQPVLVILRHRELGQKKLLDGQVNDAHRQDLRTIFNDIHISDDEEKELAQMLTEEQRADLLKIFSDFDDHLEKIIDLTELYQTQRNLLAYGTVVGASLFVAGIILVVVLCVEEFAQFGCVHPECDKPGYKVYSFKYEGEQIYCAREGTDYQCLKYLRQVLFEDNLATKHKYTLGCSPNLNPSLNGMDIPLGAHHWKGNKTCQWFVGLFPLLGMAPVALESLICGLLWAGMEVKIRCQERALSTHLQWDNINFAFMCQNLSDEPADKLRSSLRQIGKICGMPGCDDAHDILENWGPGRIYRSKKDKGIRRHF